MSISGLPPSGGANRIANSYGFAPKRAPAEVTGHRSSVERPATDDPRPASNSISLRSVLNDEERAYFDQLSAMGPITYGPGSKGTGMVPEAPRGLRLDVRG